ncbi:MAG TPA: PEP-CTERM sorting domain-containing protein [Bryobacteraceae bacterium]|nr:PEP-CTERM sorting domain-containing protein [Bryobacteraceae bacterium]
MNGSLTVNGGTVKPGDSPGELTVNGSFTEPTTGNLMIQIASLASFDILNVEGQANLGGTVSFTALDGFVVAAGETFFFLDYSSLNGTFNTVDLTGLNLPPGLTAEVLYGVGNGDQAELRINGTGGTAAPEPSMIFLFAAGLGILGTVRVLRRKGN